MNKENEPVFVTKPFLPPIDEFIKMTEKLWETKVLTNNGQFHSRFESELKDYLCTENISLIANGHLALEIALKSMELSGEVITTPFTFVSTVASIVNVGLTPVFCDIKLDFTIDEDQIEALITDKTCAIMPVHVYGFPCNVDRINELAKKYNLKVIYDAAHAFGVEIGNRPIASFGDISMFSFHATKVFHAIEGGALAYNNDDYKKNIELLRNFGISGPETIELVGTNAKMNEFQSIMGLLNLKYINEAISKRKIIYERYISNLCESKIIKTFTIEENIKFNYAYMPVLFKENRDAVFVKLAEKNIHARKYFYPIVSEIDRYKNYRNANNLLNAPRIGTQIMTLPIFPELPLETVDYICHIITRI